jgi:hypothetical protein
VKTFNSVCFGFFNGAVDDVRQYIRTPKSVSTSESIIQMDLFFPKSGGPICAIPAMANEAVTVVDMIRDGLSSRSLVMHTRLMCSLV